MKKRFIFAVLALFIVTGAGGFWLLNREQEPRLDVISRKDALEDYDYLWETLEENYPFFGVAERKYELDIQQLKQEYREQLESMGREIDFLEFYHLMEDCVGWFNGLGHLIIYSPQSYQYHMAGKEYISQYALGNWQLENYLEDSKVQERYEFLESKEPSFWSEQPQSERLILNRLQDDIAYMAINHFDGQYIQQDREKILNFFRENADVPYLIIDIQDNGGGSSEYWSENIVTPNITKQKVSPQLFITPYGEKSQKQLNLSLEAGGKSEEDFHAQLETLKKFPKIQLGALLPGWRWIEDEGYVVSPQADEAIYKGKIFLLANSKTGSAADGFAYFCKETGFATILGRENTRGDGPGGDFVMDKMPHSNLLFRYRPVLALDMEGAALEEFGVAPDVLLPTRAKNSNDKISPLAACLSYIDGLEKNK